MHYVDVMCLITDAAPAEVCGMGLRQRVMIGRAITRKPKLFLFDESLSNLDDALRVQTRIEIANRHRELGATMIHVTHDQVAAMTLADRIVVLRDGRIEQVGAPMTLSNNSANEFVAGFRGAPKMNFLNAPALGQPGQSFGIRPEYLTLTRDTGLIEGRISHVEHLDGETLVYLRADPYGVFTVRLFGEHDVQVDEGAFVTPDMARACHFAEDGQRLAA